jgi:DNA primase
MALQNTTRLFDDGAKEEVRSLINIADIVGRHVNLKPAGQNLKGLCPFHKEKTPSFTVSPAKGIFYCFGCHKGGDVFTFLMELEGLTFPEALSMLADEAGVKLRPAEKPSYTPTGGDVAPSSHLSKTELFSINRMALDFYYRQTRSHPAAIEYFLSRGLSREIIREFKLGFAPDQWTAFIDHAKSGGVSASLCVASGLAVVKQETRGVYDRFRNRIMFPIFDGSGRPVGFAGRGLSADSQPKYLNSPETPLYQKNKILYGFHAAARAIRENKSVIIVEGYMDFLALYQAGVKNVIATAGTAFTDTHARTLRRFTSTIFLVFDGDSAGVLAARRAIVVLAPYNFDIRVLIIPDQDDPDDFIKKHGKEKFLELLDKAVDYMRFIIDRAIADNPADTPYGKSAALDALVPLIGSLGDAVVRREFIKQAGESLSVPEDIIYTRIRQVTSAPGTLPQKQSTAAAAYFATIEGNFIRILINHPDLINEARRYVQPETFSDQFSGKLYFIVLKSFDQDSGLKTLLANCADEETKRIVSCAFLAEPKESDAREEMIHSIGRLQMKFLKQRMRDVSDRIKKEPGNRTKLLEQLKDYSTQLKALAQT